MLETSPARTKASFACPHCGAFAQHRWFDLYCDEVNAKPFLTEGDLRSKFQNTTNDNHRNHYASLIDIVQKRFIGVADTYNQMHVKALYNSMLSQCAACHGEAIWIGENIVFPRTAPPVPAPNPDMPPDVRVEYMEAAEVLQISPRAAAALLRLALEKLCGHLLEKKSDINKMIGDLVKTGLSPTLQMALDYVRVIGNEAVHPGQIDLIDDQETAAQLFRLLNIIVESMISQPKHIAELYAGLPQGKRDGIADRDKPKT